MLNINDSSETGTVRLQVKAEGHHTPCMLSVHSLMSQPCRHYSNRYVSDEDAAKKAKLGLWAGEVFGESKGQFQLHFLVRIVPTSLRGASKKQKQGPAASGTQGMCTSHVSHQHHLQCLHSADCVYCWLAHSLHVRKVSNPPSMCLHIELRDHAKQTTCM
jgi:hypothetical protein